MNKIAVAFAVILLSLTFVPMASAAQVTRAGDLLKASGPAVYYLGADGKRYVFPNDKIFFSWYDDFSTVNQISDEQLASYLIGGNVTYRPGTRIIKIQTDPKVYAVDTVWAEGDLIYKKPVIRWITSEAIAESIYGDEWASRVDDVADSFFSSYELGVDIVEEHGYGYDPKYTTGIPIIHDLYGILIPEREACESCLLEVWKASPVEVIDATYASGTAYWSGHPSYNQTGSVFIKGDPEIDITGVTLSYNYSGSPFEQANISVNNNGRYYGEVAGNPIYPTFGTSTASAGETKIDFSTYMYADEESRSIRFVLGFIKLEPNTEHQFTVTEIRGLTKEGDPFTQSVNVPLDIIRVGSE